MENRSDVQRVAVLRETMIRQEVMFKEQVHELHRLYQKQKILMNGLKAAELGTMDLLQCLSREDARIRVKKRKTLDLEQVPDDNDEETEYIYEKPRESIPLGLSKENCTLDFRELHQPTLSLFPIPNNTSLENQKLGRTSDQISAIAQPYTSTLREPWWKSLGEDGARLIGQIVRECQQPMSSPYSYRSMPESNVTKLFFNANTNSNRNGFLDSRTSYAPQWQHFNFNDSLAPPPLPPPPPPPRPTTFNGFSLEANRISWCSGNNFMLPGNSIKIPVPLPAAAKAAAGVVAEKDEKAGGDGTIKPSEDAKPVTGQASSLVCQVVETAGTVRGRNDRIGNSKLVRASCTDTDLTADALTDSDKHEEVVDLNKNISDDTLVNNKDSITWAATILLSLAPDKYKCSSHMSRVHESSSLLSADVKLFKSVVIMLRQSGCKGSKKLLVKSYSDGKGDAAATLLESLKKSVGEDKGGRDDKAKAVTRSNGKKKSYTAWMWGDVTRKKRMQRHRSNHPQQVQQVRCLN